MIISEIPSGIWNFQSYMDKKIDRSEITVLQYLTMNEIDWSFDDRQDADFRVYKEENIRNGLLSARRLKNEYQKRVQKYPYLNIIGEAKEYARCAYALADPERTIAVAPGTRFKRAFFATEWRDPGLDSWENRLDKLCWIGRPLPERIMIANELRELGIPFDVYSDQVWVGVPEWNGYAEPGTARKYKYQVVMENSLCDCYHSEKLINSLMEGCVTFYISDPELETPLDGAYLEFTEGSLVYRGLYSKLIRNRMQRILFSNEWEQYSFRSFFDRIIEEARRQVK